AILKEYEKEKGLYTIDDAAVMIGEALNETWNYRKLYNLMTGENKQIESIKQSNKKGRKIHKKEIERFIKERKTTREDYKRLFENEHNLSLKYFEQVEVLEKANEEKDQKIVELEARIKELEAELKKRPASKVRGAKKEKEEQEKAE
ncbi:hypothetical protein, partial [Streptococcus pneumoniae]|uniref:hypothetical protein n=2 Tax=Bacillota TaxID=1239 RepID=UPI000A680BD2